MQLTEFIIQYEESLRYYMTVMNFSVLKCVQEWRLLETLLYGPDCTSFFFCSPSFATSLYSILLDLGPQRLFIPLMPFIVVPRAIPLLLFKSLLLPRCLTSAEALGPSRAATPMLRISQQVFSL